MDPALQNKTIMVLDDNVDTSDILRFALEQEGAKVVVAHSVDEVLTTYRESPPHAVITDIRLGLSDGYALLKIIRETDTEYRGTTPVIAVTGYATPEDERRAKAAGFNAYIQKPFVPADVVSTLAGLLSRMDRPA